MRVCPLPDAPATAACAGEGAARSLEQLVAADGEYAAYVAVMLVRAAALEHTRYRTRRIPRVSRSAQRRGVNRGRSHSQNHTAHAGAPPHSYTPPLFQGKPPRRIVQYSALLLHLHDRHMGHLCVSSSAVGALTHRFGRGARAGHVRGAAATHAGARQPRQGLHHGPRHLCVTRRRRVVAPLQPPRRLPARP